MNTAARLGPQECSIKLADCTINLDETLVRSMFYSRPNIFTILHCML